VHGATTLWENEILFRKKSLKIGTKITIGNEQDVFGAGGGNDFFCILLCKA